MIFVSLALNLLVLVPVCLSLLFNVSWTKSAYGGSTPARGILLSIYIAILIVSAALIVALLVYPSPRFVGMAVALFVVQIIYKVTTPITVGSIRNPVVLSNLAIALIHVITVAVIWNQS